MNACEYLARVGFADLLGDPTDPFDGLDPLQVREEGREAYAAAIEAAKKADQSRVLDLLLSDAPRKPGSGDGAYYLRPLTWPDRVPGLKTWAGVQTLRKILEKMQEALGGADLHAGDDLFEFSVPLEGASGFDPAACPNSIDVGFSVAAVGAAVRQRPALELLAAIGLEAVPLVSFGYRDCGFFHGGKIWRFPVEPRDGGYYYRWGKLSEVAT